MKKTPALRFFKCYTALVGAFDPAEVIFILYMEQMTLSAVWVTAHLTANNII